MENLKYTEILKLNKSLAGTIDTKPYRIGILSNVTINSFTEILEYNCRIHQIEPSIEIGNFDNIVQDSAVFSGKEMVIVFYELLSIVDGLGIVFESITDAAFEALQQKLISEIDIVLANLKNTPSVIFNLFSSAALPQKFTASGKADILADRLNQYLISQKTPNLSLIDNGKIVTQLGTKQSFDFRFYYSSSAPYTVAFLKAYALAIQPVLLRNNGKLKKALIFDCDNTLWSGIVGEDGINGINYLKDSAKGKFFYAVQQLAAFYSTRGIIIGLCSKNNPEDVEEILRNPAMVLNNDHIVIKKINWQDKATNLRELAHDLNIGLDSIIFVDDSPFEVNLIKQQIPEILTLQVPDNIADYPSLLQTCVQLYFNLELSTEDAAKTAMYKQQSQRESAKSTYSNIEDYLSSLEIALTVSENDTLQIPRLAQLTQKTNQFNLTTKRYTEAQIEAFIQSGRDFIFALHVKDKFGDSGLTGMCIVKTDGDKTAVIDTLLMSCRIIGRNIEFVFFNYVVRSLQEKGIETIVADFVPTKKNAQVNHFYNNSGMQVQAENEDGSKHYSLSISAFHPKTFNYIGLVQ
jgi:FkbH-like protein